MSQVGLIKPLNHMINTQLWHLVQEATLKQQYRQAWGSRTRIKQLFCPNVRLYRRVMVLYEVTRPLLPLGVIHVSCHDPYYLRRKGRTFRVMEERRNSHVRF